MRAAGAPPFRFFAPQRMQFLEDHLSSAIAPVLTSAVTVKFRGVALFFDGKEWIVPPLSVRQFRDNLSLLTEPVGEVTPANGLERMTKFIPIIGMALRRNYPDVTDESLLDALDLGTFVEALLAVQRASGMKAARPGEAQPATA